MDHLEKCRRTQSTMFVIEDDDILTEILLWLSSKSVVQLKSVCKRWRSLISSQHFSVLHTLHHPTTTASTSSFIVRRWRYRDVYQYKTTHSKYNYLSLQHNNSYICKTPFTLSGYIIQSCHGLLLCRYPKNAPTDYYIYNLATRLWRSFDIKRTAIEGLTLAFDPSKSAYYKLICVKLVDFRGMYYQIDVFDSKSSSWSVLVRSFTVPLDVDLSHGIYWNNAIHWEGESSSMMYLDVDKGVIGTCPKVPTISQITSSDGIYSQAMLGPWLVESGGHFYYIISNGLNLGVLELEKDYSKWSIKYEVDSGGLSDAFSGSLSLIGIVRTQNKDQLFLLLNVPGKLMAYNLIDESFEELLELGENSLPFDPCDVCQFVETLAPV